MESLPTPPSLPTTPSYKLFSVGQIILATFLGSPLPGMWMLSINFKRLGQKSKATNMLLIGVGLTILNLVFAFIVPNRVSPLSVSMPFIIVASVIARMQFTKPFEMHAANGGQKDSWGKAVGYALAGFVLIIAIVFVVMMLLPESGLERIL